VERPKSLYCAWLKFAHAIGKVCGEPIVCTPEDAWRCFMRTRMDYLVVGSFVLDKSKQTRQEELPEVWLKYTPPD